MSRPTAWKCPNGGNHKWIVVESVEMCSYRECKWCGVCGCVAWWRDGRREMKEYRYNVMIPEAWENMDTTKGNKEP